MPGAAHRGIALIQREVALGAGERSATLIEAPHLVCAPARRVQREAPAVGKDIQNTPSARQALDTGAILTLIEEEARLLTAHRIDLETQAVLLEDDGRPGSLAHEPLPFAESVQRRAPLAHGAAETQDHALQRQCGQQCPEADPQVRKPG